MPLTAVSASTGCSSYHPAVGIGIIRVCLSNFFRSSSSILRLKYFQSSSSSIKLLCAGKHCLLDSQRRSWSQHSYFLASLDCAFLQVTHSFSGYQSDYSYALLRSISVIGAVFYATEVVARVRFILSSQGAPIDRVKILANYILTLFIRVY